MERSIFAAQLADAARRAVEFAREFVEEHLPDAVRFRVELNSSYDGNPLHADERVYPDDRRVHLAEHIARMEMEGMVELLWRDGAFPEWINLSVDRPTRRRPSSTSSRAAASRPTTRSCTTNTRAAPRSPC